MLPLDHDAVDRWPVAATWALPVGDPTRLGAPAAADEPPFTLNRGVEWARHRATHQGADLANGRAGDPARAAAGGIVALVHDGDNGNGYGGHVVIAHRLRDGRYVYTVYAHLLAGSIAVRPGDVVSLGDPVGRIGQSGRASTPHLHFELREPRDLAERWERARVRDPLAFVREHSESGEADDSETPLADGAAPAGDGARDDPAYARWAREQGLLPPAADPARPLTRADWWHMVAVAVVAGPDGGTSSPGALRDSLMDAGVLPEEEADAPPEERLGWEELARDLKRLRQLGVRIPHGPLAAAPHAAACERRFGQAAPASHTGSLRRRPGDPTVADAWLVLADLSGPKPEPGYGRAGRAAKPARVHRAPARKHRPQPAPKRIAAAGARRPAT